MLAEGKVRGKVACRPRLQQCWRVRSELVQRVAELRPLNGVDRHLGHIAGVYIARTCSRSGQRPPTCRHRTPFNCQMLATTLLLAALSPNLNCPDQSSYTSNFGATAPL